MGNQSLANGKLDIDDNLISMYNRRYGKGTFYTSALIEPRKKEKTEYDVKKTLIDPKATLNLIALRMVEKITCMIYEDESMVIKVANKVY